MLEKKPENDIEDKLITRNLILIIIVTLILIPIAVFTFVLRKSDTATPSQKASGEASEAITPNSGELGADSKKASKTPKKGKLDDNENYIIKNSYCDSDLTPVNSKYGKYIYYSAIKDNCALVIDENLDYYNEFQVSSYSKAISMKNAWLEQYKNVWEKTTSPINFTYGKYTILNENGNLLGWTLTLSYNSGMEGYQYALDKTDKWIKLD